MDVESRLDDLQARKRQREMILEAVRAGAVEGVRPAAEHFQAQAHRRPAGEALLEAMPHGEVRERSDGRVLLFRSIVELDGEGPYAAPIGERAILERGEVLAQLYPELADLDGLDPTRIAFLDTETTGLAGGTGTLAFLIGIGFFERDEAGRLARFTVEQYLIEDFCHEPAQLRFVAERLAAFQSFGTYNGRAFDLSLLQTRGVLNRLRPAIWRKPHMDLLPFSRRLWKEELASVSLTSVEENILGIRREQDIESALIPQIWTHFARTGHCGAMPLVLHHNAQDIVSLGCLLALQARCVAAPEEPGVLRRAGECRGMARWFERAGDLERACRLYERSLDLPSDEQAEQRTLWRLAALCRRRAQWERALDIWRGFQPRPLAVSLPAWIELAKYLEHRARDHAAARLLVCQCVRQLEIEEELRLLRGLPAATSIVKQAAEEMRRRLERLDRKIERARRAT